MAHQFSAAPPYGAQYSATPFYSPFASSTGQQIGNGIPGLQPANVHHPNPQTPTTHANAARYDANAHIHAQSTQLPFIPPHFNPELLKHFPPPPPPPPGAHFRAIPSPVSGFPTFPQIGNLPSHPTTHQNFSQLAQQTTPSNVIALHNQSATPANDPRLYNPATNLHGAGGMTDLIHNQMSFVQGARHDHTTSLSRGAFLDRIEDMVDNHTKQTHPVSKDHELRHDSSNNSSTERQPQFPPPTVIAQVAHSDRQDSSRGIHGQVPVSAELKERAKAALLSLLPHNIKYNDFRAEGVDSQILQHLYEELGLNWQKPPELKRSDMGSAKLLTRSNNDSMTNVQHQTMPLAKPLASAVAVSPITKPTPTTAPLAVAPIVPNRNMERKDRIAQLLAAKAGKAVNLGTSSKSQSPSSAVESNQPPAGETEIAVLSTTDEPSNASLKAAQTDLVRQKVEELKKAAILKIKPHGIQTALTTPTRSSPQSATHLLDIPAQQAAALPTPIREHLVQNGFSSLIPGLFLTAAELEEDAASAIQAANQNASAEQSFTFSETAQPAQFSESTQTIITQSAQSSRKRSIEENVDTPTEDRHSSKRQALQSADPLDVSMEVNEVTADDDASEGEIIEEAPVPQGVEVAALDSTVARSQQDSDQPIRTSNNTEIEALRKKIHGVGARHSLKPGQSFLMSPTGSNTSTPPVHSASVTVLSSPISKVVEQTHASTKPDDRPGQSPRPLIKATQEQIAERAAQLKADFLRSRALRQKQLQDGIPALDDEVARTQHKLKHAKEKLSQVQSDIQQQNDVLGRTLENKRTLVREIEDLERQLSVGVSGQKQYSSELSNLKQDNTKGPAVHSSLISGAPASQTIQPSSQTPKSKDNTARAVEIELAHRNMEADHSSLEAGVTSTSAHDDERFHDSESLSVSDSIVDAEAAGHVDSNNHADAEAASTDDSGVPSPGEIVPVLATGERGIEDVEQMQDSDEAMEESDNDSDDSHMSIDEETNDSVSMSASGSDDYEPAEPEESPQTDNVTESDEYEPAVEGPHSLDRVAEEEGDDYEPVETLSLVEAAARSPSSSSPPKSALTSPSQRGADSNIDEGNELNQEKALTVSEVSPLVNGTNVDDLEKGLQLSEADTLTKTQSLPFDEDENVQKSNVLGANGTTTVRFMPYQSPLTSLKSYRFHPSFNENVRNGYRSLTYSHKIDPKAPLCLTELDGDLCTDPHCQEQHFGSMALTDDKILVQMSSASDIKDKKLRDQFLVGLKQVIARLRQEGVKDFTAVADALSHYRRDWKAAQAGS